SCLTLVSFGDTACTAICTPSLHDALPICPSTALCQPGPLVLAMSPSSSLLSMSIPWGAGSRVSGLSGPKLSRGRGLLIPAIDLRSEEHTSELQSRENIVCRLLLEKKRGPT